MCSYLRTSFLFHSVLFPPTLLDISGHLTRVAMESPMVSYLSVTVQNK
jgi:hypothetical protein